MRKIANTAELQSELRRLLAYVATDRPSRSKIASELDALSARLMTAMSTATVKAFCTLMSSYVTQFDQKLEHRQPNPHRLALYLEALHSVEEDVRPYMNADTSEAMEALKASAKRRFNSDFPPLKKLLKAIDEWLLHKKLPRLVKEF